MMLDGELISFEDFKDWLDARTFFSFITVEMSEHVRSGRISVTIITPAMKGNNVTRKYYMLTQLTPSIKQKVLALADKTSVTTGLTKSATKKTSSAKKRK